MLKHRTKRLILHVGLPKTGTSALQRWLRCNRAALREFGISYPDRHRTDEDKHVFAVRDLQNNSLQELTEVLAEETCETLLLSNEGMSNHFYDFSGDAIANFREATAGVRKEIVFVTREPNAWLHSYYKQCVINPDNGASDLWGTGFRLEDLHTHPRIKNLTDHDRLKRDMVSGYNANRVLHLSYDEDWFGSLLEYLGLSSLRHNRLARINESLPDWAIELMRQVNLRGLPEDLRRPWIAVLQEYLAPNHSILRGAVKADWARDLRRLDLTILDEARKTPDFCSLSGGRRDLEDFARFVNDAQHQLRSKSPN